MSETVHVSATSVPHSRTCVTVDGITYDFISSEIYAGPNMLTVPELGSIKQFGFSANPDDKDTYIAPDGKLVPRFTDAYVIGKPEEKYQYQYSGDLYVPDTVRSQYSGKFYYVLSTSRSYIGKNVRSIRTPYYEFIWFDNFHAASNLQKVQIGACYAVAPFAFWHRYTLETVIFEQFPYVFKLAFTDIVAIKEVVLLSDVDLPFLESDNVFDDSVYKNAILYLPDNLMEKCENDPVWSKFVHKKSLKECPVEIMKP